MSRVVVYTRHAEEQLARRKLEKSWIELTIDRPEIRRPDPNDPSLERLFRSLPERGGRFLRVVVCFEGDEMCRVVTVHLDRGMGRFPR